MTPASAWAWASARSTSSQTPTTDSSEKSCVTSSSPNRSTRGRNTRRLRPRSAGGDRRQGAVDRLDAARDVGSVVRAEEDDELADLRGEPEPARRDRVDVELL